MLSLWKYWCSLLIFFCICHLHIFHNISCCIRIVINFIWKDCTIQKKWKITVMQNLRGKRCVLLEMCKWWMKLRRKGKVKRLLHIWKKEKKCLSSYVADTTWQNINVFEHFLKFCTVELQYNKEALLELNSQERGVLPYYGLLGMCCWMLSHFHDWIDYNGVAFSIDVLEWGRTFADFWDKKVLHIYS